MGDKGKQYRPLPSQALVAEPRSRLAVRPLPGTTFRGLPPVPEFVRHLSETQLVSAWMRPARLHRRTGTALIARGLEKSHSPARRKESHRLLGSLRPRA